MAILAAMQAAAIRLVGKKPTVFFGANGALEIEFCDLLNEVAADIAASHDWQALTRIYTLTADGTSSEYPFPSDYDRQLLKSNVQDPENWIYGYRHVPDINEFSYIQNRGFQLFPGIWTIYGGNMQFTPPPRAGQSAYYPYVSKNWAQASGGTSKAAFDADTDAFLLPERLLTLGLIWRWRDNKNLDYTGDQEAFVKAIDEYSARDGGSRIYRSGVRRSLPNTVTAFPWALGGSN